MSEGHRFEVNSKGEAYDVGIRNLRNKLYPLLTEAREIVAENPDMVGKENDLVFTMLTVRFGEDELDKIFEQLNVITSRAQYRTEDNQDLNAFMEGNINWSAVVLAALQHVSDNHA